MKVAILHLSDFHLKEGQHYKDEIFDKLIVSLRKLGNVERFIIAFTGDLSNSGKVNEFRVSRYVIGKIISDLKRVYNHEFVDLLMVPGNHDLDKSQIDHEFKEIDEAYGNNTHLDLYNKEMKLLDNYYSVSHANTISSCENKSIHSKLVTINDDYIIQFNLINTAPFSTLKPNDKELHFIPTELLSTLKKQNNVNINITLMHHTTESFNYRCKNLLHKAILNNSEFLLTGHDHSPASEKSVQVNAGEINISRGGEMNFDNVFKGSSFNIILIDTEINKFNQYSVIWDIENQIFKVKDEVNQETIKEKTDILRPLQSFIDEIDKDILKTGKVVSDYFVFPKIYSEEKNSFGKEIGFSSIDDFVKYLERNPLTTISSDAKLGKSTLLIQLYLHYVKIGKVPLLIADKNTKKLNNRNFVKRIFEDQYGDSSIDYEKYQQLDKKDRILLIDDFDYIRDGDGKDRFIEQSKESFGNIVFTCKNLTSNIVEQVEEHFTKKLSSQVVKIKPFYADSRNSLIRSICKTHSEISDSDVDKIVDIVDAIVGNNNMFNLEPLFIAKYTKFFLEKPSIEYVRGEDTFGFVFEHSLRASLLENSRKDDVEEIVMVLEELAACMFRNKKDILSKTEFNDIVLKYNKEYGNFLDVKTVLDSCINAEILYVNDDFEIAFNNNNYLAYFVAKFLLRTDINSTEWNYLFDFMCYGINSDIILFITYLSQNTKIIQSISNKLELILTGQKELDFNKNTLEFVFINNDFDVSVPSENEYKEMKKVREKKEELRFEENKLVLKETFELDKSKLNSPSYKISISIKYLEILAKSLPRLNSMMKVEEKQTIINLLYSHTQKIVYSMLAPIQNDFEDITDKLFQLVSQMDEHNKITKIEIEELLSHYGKGLMLSTYNHFAKFAVSSKTINLLLEHESDNINHEFMKAVILDNLGDTNKLTTFVQKKIESTKDYRIQYIYKLIIRKHLLVNPNMKIHTKHSIIDKFFGNKYRKEFLLK